MKISKSCRTPILLNPKTLRASIPAGHFVLMRWRNAVAQTEYQTHGTTRGTAPTNRMPHIHTGAHAACQSFCCFANMQKPLVTPYFFRCRDRVPKLMLWLLTAPKQHTQCDAGRSYSKTTIPNMTVGTAKWSVRRS